jgi:hypothetical protein
VSRQVGRVLLLQALLPLIFQTIPSTFFIFTAVIGHDVPFWSTFLNAQTWTSCMYPVATMAIIGHYRREIWKLVKSMRTTPEPVSVYPSAAWIWPNGLMYKILVFHTLNLIKRDFDNPAYFSFFWFV